MLLHRTSICINFVSIVLIGMCAARAQPIPSVQKLTFLRGDIRQIAVDKSGQIYLTGLTFDKDFPVTPNALETTLAGGGLYPQGFLAHLDASGSKILYATYLPGLRPNRLAVDDSGFMYVFADHYEQPPEDVAFDYPASFPFPISPNAAQTQPAFPASSILAKFAPTGELVYSTFVGGLTGPFSGYVTDAHIGAIAVDSRGAAVVCGSTFGRDLPTNATSFQHSRGGGWDAYITRVSPDGTAFEATTYLGGAGDEFCADLRLDASGNVFAYGSTTSRLFPVTPGASQTSPVPNGNLFVASLDYGLTNLRWSTFVPGSDAQVMTLDPNGNLLLFGLLGAPSFPGSPDVVEPWAGSVQRYFAAVLGFDGAKLLFSQTFSFAFYTAQAVSDQQGNVYLTGFAAGLVQGLAVDQTLNAAPGQLRVILARFNSRSRILTYLGAMPDSMGFDTTYTILAPVAIAGDGKLLLAGDVLGGAASFSGGAALVAADFSAERLPLVTQVRNSTWAGPSQVSPGELIEVRGLGIGPADTVLFNPTVGAPTMLAETRVLFSGIPAALVSVGNTSTLAVAPQTIAGGRKVDIAVERDGVLSDARSVAVVSVNPGILTRGGTGTGPADAINQDGTANSSIHPAQKGSNLRLYATGLGDVGTSQNRSALSATLDGLPMPVVGIVPATDRPPGCFQIDVTIPGGVPGSDFVLIQIAVNGAASQPGVTVAVH